MVIDAGLIWAMSTNRKADWQPVGPWGVKFDGASPVAMLLTAEPYKAWI